MGKAAQNFAGETTAAVNVMSLPLDVLMPDEHQVRRTFDEDALQQLADSIREHGVIQPIVVRPIDATGVAPFQIIAGERRYRAAGIAGLQSIPAIVRADLVGQDISVLQILENLQRADLSLPETAAGVAKLVEKIGNGEAAKQLGKSEAWVSKHARIGGLPDEIRTLVDEGKIASADIALDLAKAVELSPKHWLVEHALRDAQTGELTREDMRRALDSAKTAAEAAARQRDLLAQQNDDDQEQDEETPEQIAARRAREQREDEAEREWQKREKAIAKRRQQIQALTAECKPQIIQWLEALEQRGLKLDRDEDTGELDEQAGDYIVEGENEAMVRPVLYIHGDSPVPKSIEATRFELGIFLTWAQLQTVMAALLGKPKASAQKPATDAAGDDTVAAYLADRITNTGDDAHRIKAADVHAHYVAWCKKTKRTPLAFNDNAWGDAIAAAGISKHRLKTGVHYLGVALK